MNIIKMRSVCTRLSTVPTEPGNEANYCSYLLSGVILNTEECFRCLEDEFRSKFGIAPTLQAHVLLIGKGQCPRSVEAEFDSLFSPR